MSASAAALEFKVEFSFKSKQLRTVKWCLTSHNNMHRHNNINYTTVCTIHNTHSTLCYVGMYW